MRLFNRSTRVLSEMRTHHCSLQSPDNRMQRLKTVRTKLYLFMTYTYTGRSQSPTRKRCMNIYRSAVETLSGSISSLVYNVVITRCPLHFNHPCSHTSLRWRSMVSHVHHNSSKGHKARFSLMRRRTSQSVTS